MTQEDTLTLEQSRSQFVSQRNQISQKHIDKLRKALDGLKCAKDYKIQKDKVTMTKQSYGADQV